MWILKTEADYNSITRRTIKTTTEDKTTAKPAVAPGSLTSIQASGLLFIKLILDLTTPFCPQISSKFFLAAQPITSTSCTKSTPSLYFRV